MKLNRDEYRALKSYSKEQLEIWLQNNQNIMYEVLRKQFDAAYREELDNSIQNFLITIAFTLHYSEDVHLDHDALASFMDDLFVSVDMFRKGEYKPEDYEKQLEEDGITFSKYDYDKLYREKDTPYKIRCEKALKYIEENGKDTDLEEIKLILETA